MPKKDVFSKINFSVANNLIEKSFLINFNTNVGYKKNISWNFYLIKFLRNKIFCEIARKIDFLKIFWNTNPHITKVTQNMYFLMRFNMRAHKFEAFFEKVEKSIFSKKTNL